MGLVRCPAVGPLQLRGQGRMQTAWRLLVDARRRLWAGRAAGQRQPGGSPSLPSVALGAHVLPEASP